MTNLSDCTSRIKIEEGTYPYHTGFRQKIFGAIPISELEVGQNLTIPFDLFEGKTNYLRTLLNNKGQVLQRRFRTKTQPNRDLKVYRVA